MGRSPLDRAGRLVPLPEAEAGASERARAPAPQCAANCTDLSQVDTPLRLIYEKRSLAIQLLVTIGQRFHVVSKLDPRFSPACGGGMVIAIESLAVRDAFQAALRGLLHHTRHG